MDKPIWRSRIVGHGEKPAKEFLANPFNWRGHPKYQADALEGVLDEVGWVDEVLENVRTGHLIDGHLRIRQALAHGEDTPVPYTQVDLSEEEEALVLATFDPLGAMAVTDDKKQAELLSILDDDSAELVSAILQNGENPFVEDRTLEQIDLENLPEVPQWVLITMPVSLLPDVKIHLDALESAGAMVEYSVQ